jgi:hypothetical protein
LDDIYTFIVRGSASKLPRGYIWLVPVWFGILAVLTLIAGHEISGRIPVWLGATELGSLLLACLTVFCVMATVRRNAFRVSSHGIWLGCSTTRKRPRLRQVHISWADVAQVRMAATYYGTLLEISLGPSARIVHRPGAGRQALVLLGALIMPVGFGRGRPGLTAARENPPRYLVRVCDVPPAELRDVLTLVKSTPAPVRILTRAGPLRFPPMERRAAYAGLMAPAGIAGPPVGIATPPTPVEAANRAI